MIQPQQRPFALAWIPPGTGSPNPSILSLNLKITQQLSARI